jgi:hypothetical protein
MYEEIRKPRLLSDIPSIIIRPLPCIYYYSSYAGAHIPDHTKTLFINNVTYLSEAVKRLGKKLNQDKYVQISNTLNGLVTQPITNLRSQLEKATLDLATLCTKNRSELRKGTAEFKIELNALYKEMVPALKILVVDNNGASERLSKLIKTLTGFCLYDVDNTTWSSHDYAKKQIDSDFIVFTSTASPEIHDLVKSLVTYHKPGLAMVHIDSDGKTDQQSIRHGSQLLKIGFPVLFKVFTPIRLFTTIDKTYMKFHLHH